MKETCFVSDIYLAHMLYATTIRSPVASGLIKSIDCPKMPSGYFLIKAKDIPGKNSLAESDHPVLTDEVLSYKGEPVAILVGPDIVRLEEYAGKCKVIAVETEEVTQEIITREISSGSTDEIFKNAALVIRGKYRTGIQEHWYAEPVGAVAYTEITADGKRIIVRTASQLSRHVSESVSSVLALEDSRVNVIPTITGMHLDGKLWYPSLIACHSALGAWISGKPVRLILSRKEDLLFSPKRCAVEIDIASAHNEKGEIDGLEVQSMVNLGAYGVNVDEILSAVNLGAAGVYKTKNITIKSSAQKTCIPPQGSFAGHGSAQGFFAIERHISAAAEQLIQDPAQWRKDNSSEESLITTVTENSDYNRKWASYELIRRSKKEKNESLRGIGIAVCGRASAVVEVAIDPVEFIPLIRGIWICADGLQTASGEDTINVIKNSVLQSLGWAFYEQLQYVNGIIPDVQYDCFQIYSPSEIPDINIELISCSEVENIKPEELPFSCVPAAWLQAVSQAVNCHFTEIPLKTIDIMHAGNKS